MSAGRQPRNPGPSWGYPFLRGCDRILPEALFRPLRAAGTAVAALAMPAQRRHSSAYLARVLPRPPRLLDNLRHFFAFEESLMARLRIANGRFFGCDYDPSAGDFQQWLEGGGPALLGTMHIGTSDMLGFQIGLHEGRRIYLVRRRTANSHDTEGLARAGRGAVQFIWAGDPAELIFALRDAAASGAPIALQCDRLENAAHARAFEFLGARRLFPLTIYRLAIIFQRPVLLTVGLRMPSGRSRLYGAPRFEARPGESRAETLRRAGEHFQAFLRRVEGLLRSHPYQWFNFLPLNPEAPRA